METPADYSEAKEKAIGLQALQSMKDHIDGGREKEDPRWESFTGAFVEAVKECRVFVDVGAEWGFYIYLALKYAPKTCLIHAFEPEPVRYRLLKEFFQPYSNVSIYPYAAAAGNESRLIAKPDHGVSATLDLDIAKYPEKKGTNIEIETVALDDFLKDSEIDIIKMDIEGAEVLAFQGMSRVLKEKRPVIFLEMHPFYVESLVPNGMDFFDRLLEKNDYCVFDEEERPTTIYSGRIVLRPCPAGLRRKRTALAETDVLRKGIILYRLGKYEECKKILGKLIRMRKISANIRFQAYYHLSLAAGEREKRKRDRYLKEALEVLLVKRGKTHVDIYRIASLYKSINRLDLAEKWFGKVLDIGMEGRDMRCGIYFHLGEIGYFRQEFLRAEGYFKKCLAVDAGHKKAAKYLELMERNNRSIGEGKFKTKQMGAKWLRMNPEDEDLQSGKKLFFVTGRSKSGTTWMTFLLNSHPEIFCDKRENNAFHQDMEIFFSGKRTNEIHVSVGTYYEKRYSQLVKNGLLTNLIAGCPKDKVIRIGDKTPRQNIKNILAAFNQTQVIVMVRDFRDALVSLAYHQKRHTLSWEDIFTSPDETEFEERFIKGSLLGFEKHNDIKTYFEYADSYPEQVKIVRYEDLKTKAVDTLRGIFSFLRVDTDEQVIKKCIERNTFERHSGGRKPGSENNEEFFRKGIVGDWKNYFSPANVEVFKKYGGESLILAGYEKDNNWYL